MSCEVGKGPKLFGKLIDCTYFGKLKQPGNGRFPFSLFSCHFNSQEGLDFFKFALSLIGE